MTAYTAAAAKRYDRLDSADELASSALVFRRIKTGAENFSPDGDVCGFDGYGIEWQNRLIAYCHILLDGDEHDGYVLDFVARCFRTDKTPFERFSVECGSWGDVESRAVEVYAWRGCEMMMSPGEVVFSQQGIELSPFPGWHKNAKQMITRVNQWLIDNARTVNARPGGDDWLHGAPVDLDARNLSVADKEMLHFYLFGKTC